MTTLETRTDLVLSSIFPLLGDLVDVRQGEHGYSCFLDVGNHSFILTLNDNSFWIDGEDTHFSLGVDFPHYMSTWHCQEQAINTINKLRSVFEVENESN